MTLLSTLDSQPCRALLILRMDRSILLFVAALFSLAEIATELRDSMFSKFDAVFVLSGPSTQYSVPVVVVEEG